MIVNSALSLEEMLDKSSENENIIINKSNFFEPVKLNTSSLEDIDENKISSLFGEKVEEPIDHDIPQITSFVYEKRTEEKKSLFKNRKFQVASFLVLCLSSIGAFSLFNNSESSGFVANASPVNMIMSQNLNEKTEMLKAEIAKGAIASDSDVMVSYKVKSNDTVTKIAQKLNAPEETIKVLNSLYNEQDIVKRENILVPLVDGVVHKVKSGETVDSIANKYRTSTEKLSLVNKIKDPNFISNDQVLFIPNKKSNTQLSNELKKHKKENALKLTKKKADSREQHRVHKLGKDQTIDYLAKKYNVSTDKILEANKNIDPSNLQVGQPVIIPGKAINRNENRNRGIKLSSRSLQAGLKNGTPVSGRFIWPAKGEFSSGFGPRGWGFHRGIDIAANTGTPIKAAMGGIVTHAGSRWDYGLAVEITHSNGMVTRYGHCSKLHVAVGQIVDAGQLIADMGSTGRSTGPHLHFEIIVNGVQVNPRNYL
ncbi:MAG: peptidoglycan DD-metalloendopeptidase family protein [Candidatus Sericytochromatia bacterium]